MNIGDDDNVNKLLCDTEKPTINNFWSANLGLYKARSDSMQNNMTRMEKYSVNRQSAIICTVTSC